MQNVSLHTIDGNGNAMMGKSGCQPVPRPLLSALCRALTVRGRKGACSLYPSNTPSSVFMTQGFRGFKGEKGEPGQPGLDGLDAPCQLVQYPLFLSSPVHATILCVLTMAWLPHAFIA